jgi:hypothetical protein
LPNEPPRIPTSKLATTTTSTAARLLNVHS